jgi:hypothetical protein
LSSLLRVRVLLLLLVVLLLWLLLRLGRLSIVRELLGMPRLLLLLLHARLFCIRGKLLLLCVVLLLVVRCRLLLLLLLLPSGCSDFHLRLHLRVLVAERHIRGVGQAL